MFCRTLIFLACTLMTRLALAVELPPAFHKQSAARIATMCAACMTYSAATMAHAKKASDKEQAMAVLLYQVWLDRAEQQGANEKDSRWALNTLKAQPDQVTLRQLRYCISEGYKHFEALPAPKRNALMADLDEAKERVLNP